MRNQENTEQSEQPDTQGPLGAPACRLYIIAWCRHTFTCHCRRGNRAYRSAENQDNKGGVSRARVLHQRRGTECAARVRRLGLGLRRSCPVMPRAVRRRARAYLHHDHAPRQLRKRHMSNYSLLPARAVALLASARAPTGRPRPAAQEPALYWLCHWFVPPGTCVPEMCSPGEAGRPRALRSSMARAGMRRFDSLAPVRRFGFLSEALGIRGTKHPHGTKPAVRRFYRVSIEGGGATRPRARFVRQEGGAIASPIIKHPHRWGGL